MKDTSAQSVVFNQLFGRSLHASFDQLDSSPDGAALLLKASGQKLGLIDAISTRFRDDRHQGKASHSAIDLVQLRVFGIVCGYEDCSGLMRLATDPVQRLLMDRDPLTGR